MNKIYHHSVFNQGFKQTIKIFKKNKGSKATIRADDFLKQINNLMSKKEDEKKLYTQQLPYTTITIYISL